MATGTEGAGTAAKILETIRELPFWLLLGLAIALNLVVLVPALAREFPPEYRPWLIPDAPR